MRAEENAERRFTDKNWAIVETLVAVADDAGRTPAGVAIDWLRSKRWVSAPIVGANTPEQLRASVDGLDDDLDDALVARLDAASDFRRSRASLET